MIIYHYSKHTNEYLGQEEADESPLEPGKYLIPANSTTIEPPPVGENEVAVFDGKSEAWEVKPDFRGKTFWSKYGHYIVITQIGEVPHELFSAERPSSSLEIRMSQFRKALLLRGLLDKFEKQIDLIEDPLKRELAKIDWSCEITGMAGWAWVWDVMHSLDLSEEKIQSIFATAFSL